jgi:dolichol-phosphate mannosyltransferase
MASASIILPAYNEEKNIGRVIESIRKAGDFEIIVVDDGSTDRTASIARKHGCVCVSFGKNRGKGYACIAGAKIATSDNIVFIDSDNQHDPSEIPKLLDALHDSDIVIGKRDFSSIPVQRRLSNMLATKVISGLARTQLSDGLCGFRAVKRSKFFKLNVSGKGYEFESEMLIKAVKNKLRIKEIQVNTRYGIGSSMPLADSAKVAMFILTQLIRR